MANQLPEGAVQIISDEAGVFIPQQFAQSFDPRQVEEGYTILDRGVLLAGPEHPHYFSVWQSVVKNFLMINREERAFVLHFDQALYLVPLITDEQHRSYNQSIAENTAWANRDALPKPVELTYDDYVKLGFVKFLIKEGKLRP